MCGVTWWRRGCSASGSIRGRCSRGSGSWKLTLFLCFLFLCSLKVVPKSLLLRIECLSAIVRYVCETGGARRISRDTGGGEGAQEQGGLWGGVEETPREHGAGCVLRGLWGLRRRRCSFRARQTSLVPDGHKGGRACLWVLSLSRLEIQSQTITPERGGRRTPRR
jgi:hypothetical protein